MEPQPNENQRYNLDASRELGVSQNSLLPAYWEIDRIFEGWEFRFEPKVKLKKPVIAILPAGQRKALGWFAVKCWQSKDGGDLAEVCICAESLGRNVYDIANTVIHEMVHSANAQLGIVDCHPSNQYHNRKFKDMAEFVGLEVEKHPQRGFAITHLTDWARQQVDQLGIDANAFSLFRKGNDQSSKRTSNKKLVRWICTKATSECVSVLVAAGSKFPGICSACWNPFQRAS